jgi:hypothetical protein
MSALPAAAGFLGMGFFFAAASTAPDAADRQTATARTGTAAILHLFVSIHLSSLQISGPRAFR